MFNWNNKNDFTAHSLDYHASLPPTRAKLQVFLCSVKFTHSQLHAEFVFAAPRYHRKPFSSSSCPEVLCVPLFWNVTFENQYVNAFYNLCTDLDLQPLFCKITSIPSPFLQTVFNIVFSSLFVSSTFSVLEAHFTSLSKLTIQIDNIDQLSFPCM